MLALEGPRFPVHGQATSSESVSRGLPKPGRRLYTTEICETSETI
jgi:hypothetical protein